MILNKIYIHSFRNLEETEISFGSRFNVFYGKNAQGKTNLLESIFLLGTMKSFRMARNGDLIKWGADYGLLKGWVEKENVTREISLLLEKQGRKAKIDQKQVTKLADFFGSLNVVVFSPEEIAMVRGMPDARRRYLDRAIFSGDASYLRLYQEYYKILKNRNTLLKNGDTNGLDVWSDKLAETGARLITKRIAYLSEIKGLLGDFYSNIAGNGEEAGVIYHSHLPDKERLLADSGALLREALTKSAAEERRRGVTVVGPHRDDLEFLLNGKVLKHHASQGQQRSYILALKMAEIEYIRQRFDYPPVLLLDDMTSELDRERSRNLMEFLETKQMQVFITTTSLNNVMLKDAENYCTFSIESGKVLN
ncbi:MAG: DNA replication and repair protein [Geobacteraceae bacterium]|nr:MAG: DNA replication and repair protein [Geobacteraceae bacterium]